MLTLFVVPGAYVIMHQLAARVRNFLVGDKASPAHGHGVPVAGD